MNAESNKQLVARYFEMWNTGDVAIADEVLATDYMDHAHPEVKGPDVVKGSIQRMRASDPTFHIAVEFMIAESDLVALRGRIQRTPKGQEQPVVVNVLWFVRVVNGKMTELWTGTESAR